MDSSETPDSSDPQGAQDPHGTRTRILLAAERLFAERGFAATSLRALVAEAEVNLAAVHYHFGSKEGLIREVFARFIGPVTGERNRRLDALESEPTPPTLEQLLDAWISPSFEVQTGSGGTLSRLMGRLQVDPVPEVEAIVISQFASFGRRYVACLARVLPGLTAEEIRWRMHFAIGTLTYTHAFAHRASRLGGPGGAADPTPMTAARRNATPDAPCLGAPDTDLTRVRERLVCFLAAAFRAPSIAEREVPKGDVDG